MSSKRYENAPLVTLSDYMPADRFRTVPAELRDVPGGVTEIPVEIDLGKATAKRLRFAVPWDGCLYGFLRGREGLREQLGLTARPTRVAVSDWETCCLLVVETDDPGTETALRVETDEVVQMLERCRRAPEQRSV